MNATKDCCRPKPSTLLTSHQLCLKNPGSGSFRQFITLCLTVVFLTVFCFSYAAENNVKLADYTIMLYINGSDLESNPDATEATNLIINILKCSYPSGVKVIAATGGTKKWYLKNGDKEVISNTNSQYWEFLPKQANEENGDFILKKTLPKSSAFCGKNALRDFLIWGVCSYPAKRYVVIFWNHGAGSIYGFGTDELNDNASIYPSGLGEAFKEALENPKVLEMFKLAGKTKFDLIAFCACLMGNIEVANELRPYADYMAGSEELAQGDFNYPVIFAALTANPNMAPVDLGRLMVNSYYEQNSKNIYIIQFTYSLIDLSKIGNVIEKWNRFIEKLNSINSLNPDSIRSRETKPSMEQQRLLRGIAIARSSAESYCEFSKYVHLAGHVDMIDFARNISNWLGMKSEMKDVEDAVRSAIVVNRSCKLRPGSNGLSMFMIDRPLEKWGMESPVSLYGRSPVSEGYANFMTIYENLMMKGDNANYVLGKVTLEDRKPAKTDDYTYSVALHQDSRAVKGSTSIFNVWDNDNMLETIWFVTGNVIYNKNKQPSDFVITGINQDVEFDEGGNIEYTLTGREYCIGDTPVPIYWDRNRDRIKEQTTAEDRQAKIAELEKKYQEEADSLLNSYKNEIISGNTYKEKSAELKKKYDEMILNIKSQIEAGGAPEKSGLTLPVGSIAVRYKGNDCFLVVAETSKGKAVVTGIWQEKETGSAKKGYSSQGATVDRIVPYKIKQAPYGQEVTLLYRCYRLSDAMYRYIEGPKIKVPKNISATPLKPGSYAGGFFMEDVIGRDVWSNIIWFTVNKKMLDNAALLAMQRKQSDKEAEEELNDMMKNAIVE